MGTTRNRNPLTSHLLRGVVTLALLPILIGLSYAQAGEESATYSLAGVLTLIWGPMTLSLWESRLIHRRLWVNQVLKPQSSLYSLIKGGALLATLSLLYALIPSFFVLLSLVQLHLYQWIVIFVAFCIKMILVQRAELRLQKYLVGSLTPYIARNIAGFIVIALTTLGLGAVHFYAPPQIDVSGGLIGVLELVEEELMKWEGSLIYPFLQVSTYTDHLYLWALSDQNLSSRLDMILRYLLLALFAFHQVIFVVAIQRVFDGIIIALSLEHRKQDLDQLDLSKGQEIT